MIHTGNGMYFIDFETLRLDLRAYDLYRLIYNSCQDNGWDFSIIKSILDGYQQISKLTDDDYQMLKIWLRYPRGICKLLVHYEQKTLPEKYLVERDFLKRLIDERKRELVLRQLDNYAQVRTG